MHSQLKKEGISGRDFKDLSAKQKSISWRINYASVNISHIDRFRQKKGGVAFYNQSTGNAIFNSGSVPVSWDYTQVINDTKVPITVINGDHDYIDFTAFSNDKLLAECSDWLASKGISEKDIRWTETWASFRQQIPSLQLYNVKNAGHNGWIDEPDLFKAHIKKGLSR